MGECSLSNYLAALLSAYGVREVVASPGTRNAPLIAAVTGRDDINVTMVVDERSAAFVALGKAVISELPVALICTSGSAMLNYAPALAEAYYRNVPVIAVTADRPHESIDRNDGQTIRQPGALDTVVKGCYTVDSRESEAVVSLTLNDALTQATMLPAGPVHINVAICNPTVIGSGVEAVTPRIIRTLERSGELPVAAVRELCDRVVAPCRVMIAAGSYRPYERLNRTLNRLASFGNFCVVAEAGSNLHGRSIVDSVDTLLSSSDFNEIKPDILITYGQPILSSRFKKLISDNHVEHWHVGLTPSAFDTFGSQTLRIETTPEAFFRQLCATMRRTAATSNYVSEIMAKYDVACKKESLRFDEAPWCELSAMARITAALPKEANIQLSNGMTIRFAQHIGLSKFHRVDCNRGVSGIDGSVSTAVGASTAYPGMTVLFTGDMSARYDISALGLRCLSPSFKMVVLCNSGGQIFRIIKPTRAFDRVEECLCANDALPIEKLAEAWGFKVFRASGFDELSDVLRGFIDEKHQPALLAIHTDPSTGSEFYTNLLKR